MFFNPVRLTEIQLQLNQENAGYAHLRDTAGPLQVQFSAPRDQTQVFDMSVADILRRLAGRYVNDPQSLVNAIHLEPGPSGRFQVVIILEI